MCRGIVMYMQKAVIIVLCFTTILGFLAGVRYGRWVQSQDDTVSTTPGVVITASPSLPAASPSAVLNRQPTNLPISQPEAQ